MARDSSLKMVPASDGVPPEFTFDGRLASFKKPLGAPKKRGSTAGARAPKGSTWPHAKYLPADKLAGAGFVWQPRPETLDNVRCFLCDKSLDGWEEGDDALEEHLKHSPNCGFAIVAAIAAGYEKYATEDPNALYMVEARKATFAGMWPHENKRGWKCKTKQLAEAGWKWTPLSQSDDMATCPYCELALDGWEQGDKPMDEHYNRSPDCPFFGLTHQYATLKKASKGKGGRASKVSRASVQSVATAVSELPSVMEDVTANVEDSVMTTASTAAGKKAGRPKKTTTAAKGRKTKAKRDEPVEVVESDPVKEEFPLPPPLTKPARGRKRNSDAMDDSVATVSEAPAAKKRATRTRASRTVERSVVEPSEADTDMADAPPAKGKGKGRKTARASNTRNTRKVSGASSVRAAASTASLRAAPGAFPDDDDNNDDDDDEIERQLEADLERPLTDDEDVMHDSDSERRRVPAKGKGAKTAKGRAQKNEAAEKLPEFSFDPYPAEDEDEVEAELQRLQEQLDAEEAAAAAAAAAASASAEKADEEEEEECLVVPKKGRKAAGTRKVSKPTKAQMAKEAREAKAAAEVAAEREREEQEQDENQDENQGDDLPVREDTIPAAEEDNNSSSTATIVNRISADSSADRTSNTGRKPGRQSKKSATSRLSAQAQQRELDEDELAVHEDEPLAEAVAEAPVEETEEPEGLEEIHQDPVVVGVPETPAEPEVWESPASNHQTPEPGTTKRAGTPKAASSSPEAPPSPSPLPRNLQLPPATPRAAHISPAASARQPAISPSPSPQASDAENQPPSSVRPANILTQKRVALAPIAAAAAAATPRRPAGGSPSKRNNNNNVVAGLRTTTPWTAVDLDAIFGTPQKKNAHGGEEVDETDKENNNYEGAMARLVARGAELTSPEKRMTVEEWIYFNAEQAEEQLKHESEKMVSRFENEGTRAMRVLEGLIVD
ncbi:BIR-domain-containing protein [Sodiomyces alkalinus F11]|uniref:BIR-domain-containing protein n=1 Tax=Sodiomyces alkalinus (strain CBS 110278 / VKM F-3762 / F11) TaxID=1314773 RepID=A0A3N2Q8F5_SODAK|nr:BIR-domain-containing protein [Sodiomyces alkalinus F11]ROT43054.1 BIR-domain-containing protein [Sodiomyces alkalinus F11]